MTYGTSVPAFYQNYINLLGNNSFMDVLESEELWKFLQDIPEEKAAFRYAEGKWSVAQLIAHLSDAERVFQYRALHISREPGVALPGFDENAWAEQHNPAAVPLSEVIRRFRTIRQSTLDLFGQMDENDLLKKGLANGYEMSVGFIGICTAGHQLHHINILRERYL